MIQFPKSVGQSSKDLSANLTKMGQRVFFVLFLLGWGLVWSSLVFQLQLSGKPNSLEALLVFLATITTLFSLSRHLPGQNVLLAAAVIAAIGGAVHLLDIKTSIPFGPLIYSRDLGPRFFHALPWVIPFVWMLAVLNSRGAARLILRPWRKTRAYGWWVIGLTVILSVLLDLGWEVFGAQVKHYWFWSETKFPVTWHGTPLVNFLGWIVTLLLILAFVTPALINKKPGSKSPPDYHPLVVWLLLNLLFLTGAAVHQLWSAVIVTAISSVIVTAFALRGARW